MANPVTIESIVRFSDASGAPAVLVCCGFRFACDFVGEIRIHNITGGYRSPNRKIIALVTRAYEREIERLGGEWVAKNQAMYAAA